ncbi:MAG: LrgB family protein [Pseudomonadota bacterium]|nr:LrgB family protein [Pseudomonadota bacterium]
MIEALEHAFSIKGMAWLLVSIVSYIVALEVHQRLNNHPISHPLIITATTVGLFLFISQTSVSDYQLHASLLHWLLGPVTVALALPIFRQWKILKHYGWRLLLSIAFGGVIAPVSAWFSLFLLDAPVAMQLTMLAKSITTPLAMEASAHIGGIPALAAVFVIVTGVVGAILSGTVFAFLSIVNKKAQGIALGTVAHAVGTAKAIHMGDDVAAMATLGLCVNGVFTAFVLPLLFNAYFA